MSDSTGTPLVDAIAVENRTNGDDFWAVRSAAATEQPRGIAGYASATSVAIGGTLDLHVSLTSPRPYTITIYRVGHYGGAGARRVLTSPPLSGEPHPEPAADAETGLVECGWPVAWHVTIPDDWISGLYVAEFAADPAGDDQTTWTGHTPFVVRDRRSTPLCVVLPFISYQAENGWPRDRRLEWGQATKASFERPYQGDGLPAQIDADRLGISWLEEQGYDVTYVTDIDVHAGRVDLSTFAGVIVTGHAEYWSAEMRAALDAALAAGTSAAFLSAKIMYWHARLEPSTAGRPDRSVVCYKSAPDPDRRPGMATLKWRVREPGPGRAEQESLGVQYTSEVTTPAPLIVSNADHWFWARTGALQLDQLQGLVADSVDAYDPRYPGPRKRWQTLLAESPFEGQSTARKTPPHQHTSVCEGADGTLIFAAGTRRWAWALSDPVERDERIRKATGNVVARMLTARQFLDTSGRVGVPEENRRPGARLWEVGAQGGRATNDKRPQIQGFAGATSVAAGSALDFNVSSIEPGNFTVSIHRIGHYDGARARQLVESDPLPGVAQPEYLIDEVTRRVACPWASSWRLDVPEHWTSGLYVAAFTTETGYRCLAPFVVRDPVSTAKVCVVVPFLTYQAHNRWPLNGVHGSSLVFGYEGETGRGATFKFRATEVSFDRPYAGSGLPELTRRDIDTISWLERAGHDLTYVTDLDLHRGDVDPGRFAGLVFVGQHEYWTRPLRAAVEAATRTGTSLAFLGAGTSHWLARLESERDRVLACYKNDPDPQAVPGQATTRWRSGRPGPGAPEQTLVGTQLIGKTAQAGSLVVSNSGHWVWAGTDVTDGATIDGIVLGQVDEVDALVDSPSPRPTVLAASPFILAGRESTETQFTAINELANGSFIFSAGTESWSLGLVKQNLIDARLQIATYNILDRMAGGRPELADATRPQVKIAERAPGPHSRGVSPVTLENSKRGSRGWNVGAGGTRANDDANRQITGYASLTSVAVGKKIDFHVSVNPAGPYTVAIYRIGWYGGVGARLLTTSPTLNGRPQSDPRTDPDTRAVVCDWPVSWSLAVPTDWTSGFYYAVFTSELGFRSMTPFVVRDPGQRDNLCVIMGVTTYQAYNQWPLDGVTGRSLYNGFAPDGSLDPELRSYTVSFDRPYARSGQPSRAEFDLAFVRWAERENFNLTYATSIDLHAGRIDPSRYAGLVFPSHDEYWSPEMRAHATAALEHGTSLAFLEGNNIYWHVRIGDAADGRAHRTITCHKSHDDPEPGPVGWSIRWRTGDVGPDLPEQLLIGIQYNGVVKRPAPLIVQEPEHWVWAGTKVEKGEAIDGVVGGEADGRDPTAAGPEVVLLARSPYELSGGGWEIHNTSVYETDAGAVVFASGSNDWPGALGLDGRTDHRIQRATANVLDRIQAARPPKVGAPPPARVPRRLALKLVSSAAERVLRRTARRLRRAPEDSVLRRAAKRVLRSRFGKAVRRTADRLGAGGPI